MNGLLNGWWCLRPTPLADTFNREAFWQSFPASQLQHTTTGSRGDSDTPRSVVKRVFQLARTNGFLINCCDQSHKVIYSICGGQDGRAEAIDTTFVPEDEDVTAHLAKLLVDVWRTRVAKKAHVNFIEQLERTGGRIQTIHSLLADEVLSRVQRDAPRASISGGGLVLEEAEDVEIKYSTCTRRKTEVKLSPLGDAESRNLQLAKLFKLLWYPAVLFCVYWACLLCGNMLSDSRAADGSSWVDPAEQRAYILFVMVETCGFLIGFYPLYVCNFLLWQLDSKLAHALCRRFIRLLDSPVQNLATDTRFHYEVNSTQYQTYFQVASVL